MEMYVSQVFSSLMQNRYSMLEALEVITKQTM